MSRKKLYLADHIGKARLHVGREVLTIEGKGGRHVRIQHVRHELVDVASAASGVASQNVGQTLLGWPCGDPAGERINVCFVMWCFKHLIAHAQVTNNISTNTHV